MIKKNYIKVIVFYILTCYIIVFTPPLAHAANKANGHFVVLVLDNTRLSNLTDASLPNLNRIINIGAIALMNTTTGGGYNEGNGFVTVGSGSRAIGYGFSSQSFNAGDIINGQKISDIFAHRNNSVQLAPHYVVNLCAGQIQALNKDKQYKVKIGALGDELRRAGLKTAVVGNSDSQPEDINFPEYVYGRQAASMVMDNNGIVDYGDVSGDILVKDSSAPFGIRTDNNKLFDAFNKNYSRSDVIVVDFGDTTRAALYARAVGEKKAAEMMGAALKRADEFLEMVMQKMDLQKDRLLVVSVNPSPAAVRAGDTLTYAIVSGQGMGKGLLTSDTTHRPGIVANIDITASILDYWGIASPPEMFGQAMKVALTVKGQTNYLSGLQASLVQNSLRRLPVLSTVAYYILAVLAFSLIMSVLELFNKNFPYWLKRILRCNFLAILTLPPGLLLMGALGPLNLFQSFMVLIAVTVLLTAVFYPLYIKYNSTCYLMLISLFFIFILFTDLFSGAHMILISPLGYDPQYGARFYGIGNELMGAVIGGSTLGLAAFTDMKKFRGKLVLVTAIMIGILFIMVFPGLGSKAGASISLTASFTTLLWLLLGFETGKKHILTIMGTILIVLVFISVADSIGVPHTHVGRAIKEIQAGGWVESYNIIARKIDMNFRLIRNSYWSGMLIESLFLMLLMFKFRIKFLEHLRRKAPGTLNGCYAALLGATVALFTNDAGIIAAATAVIYPVFSLLLLNSHTAIKRIR